MIRRRDALRIGVGVVAGSSLAGCLGSDDGDDENSASDPESGDDTERTRPPQTALDYDRSGDTLQFTHSEGDTAAGDTLFVEVDGERIERPFGAGDVEPGDATTIDLTEYPDASIVGVIWENGGASRVISAHDIR